MPSPNTITIHAWSDAGLSNINPLVWVDHRATPDAVADAAIPKLLAKPPGCKAIFHTRPMVIDVPSDRGSFSIAGNIDATLAAFRNGPNISLPTRWTRAFYRRLKTAGILPDFLVCDDEEGWNFWSLPLLNHEPNTAVFEKIFADPIIRSKMPPDVRALSPRDFTSASRHFHKSVLLWNHWTNQITGSALRKVVLDTATEVFGKAPPASNFGDVHPSFPIYDANGWERSQDDGPLSNCSSPALYLVPGQRVNFGRKKHPCWNMFLDNLSTLRSCINTALASTAPLAAAASPVTNLPTPPVTTTVVPWISHPSFPGDQPNPHRSPASLRWLWTEQLHHIRAAGIGTLLYWNPRDIKTVDPIVDDKFASEIFTDLAARPASMRPLPELPLDADQAITANYITTYQEFEKNFPVE